MSEHEVILSVLERWADKHLDPRSVVEAWPETATTPLTAAWLKSVMMRPSSFPIGRDGLAGLSDGIRRNQWVPRLRDPKTAIIRASALALCARAADALSAGEIERHTESMNALATTIEDFGALEHPELALLFASAQGAPVERGVIAQLSWRDHAASILAWCLQWHDDDPLQDFGMESVFEIVPKSAMDIRERLRDACFRPMTELLGAMEEARAQLSPNGEPSVQHSMALERVKALRWLTEPWWPELSLTPWRIGGHGFEGAMTNEELIRLRSAFLQRLGE